MIVTVTVCTPGSTTRLGAVTATVIASSSGSGIVYPVSVNVGVIVSPVTRTTVSNEMVSDSPGFKRSCAGSYGAPSRRYVGIVVEVRRAAAVVMVSGIPEAAVSRHRE